GDTLTFEKVTGPTSGTLTLNTNGSFTYTPDANFNGTDEFTFRVFDGRQYSNVATIQLTITPVNDPPVVDVGPDRTADEGEMLTFTALTGDVDGDALTYHWDFGDGTTADVLSPKHAFADDGKYTVTLTADDGHGGVTSDSLFVTVANVAPQNVNAG